MSVIATLASAILLAATPLSEVRVVPDTSATLGTATVNDEDAAADNFSTVTLLGLGGIPPETAVDAYAVRPAGAQLLSFETTVVLPGGATGRPGDVWRYEGGSYAVELDAAARGIPANANLDALALSAGSLLLSFDVSFDIGAAHFEPEDLIQFDGTTFTMFLDGSAAGVAPGLDLDGVDYLACNGHLLLSFDGSGSIGGVAFDDEDVLEFDRVSTWQMSYDGSAEHAAWDAADLVGLSASVNFGPGPPAPFTQKVTVDANKTTFRWPSATAFREVRGTFVSSPNLGTYAVNATMMGNANTFTDAATPAAGTGYWYLVKAGGCGATSWQSTIGSEAGRDTIIP